MAIKIIADDTRLGGRTPVAFPSSVSLHVDDGTPLDSFLNRCASLAQIHGGISTLYMIAQAVDQVFAGESDGGDGILFCHENIDIRNVDRLAPLRGMVEHIILIVCSPLPTPFDVYVSKASDPELLIDHQHDGDELCKQLAFHTGATVVLAREPRHRSVEAYSPFAGYELQSEADLVDFGAWDGVVTRYDANGIFATQQTNLPQWTDSFGSLQDPRLLYSSSGRQKNEHGTS